MTRLPWIFLTIQIAVALTGCGDGSATIKIGVSIPETTVPTYTLIKEAMVEGEKEYGVKVLWNGVRDAGVKQNLATLETQQIRRMLDEGIQVLIFKAVDRKRAYPILKEADSRNVPVITLDQLLVSINVRGHIAVDETGLGEAAAQYAIEEIGYKGNVLVLEEATSAESFRNISLGIYTVLDQYSDKIRVHSRISRLDADVALDLTDRVLKNYAGNIQAIIAADSTLAVGAVRGVQLHELADQIITVGVGAGEEACRQIMFKQHDAEVDTMPYQRGQAVLRAALDALNDRPFSFDVELPNGRILTRTKFSTIRLITPANYSLVGRMWPNLFED
jgi:ABC-type sugar transport system substrate-binding protein